MPCSKYFLVINSFNDYYPPFTNKDIKVLENTSISMITELEVIRDKILT